MKKIIALSIALAFVPFIASAHGHAPVVSCEKPVVPAPQSGGNLLFCSGPMAPGYHVGVVGGGCGGNTTYVPYNGTSCLFGQGCMIKQ